MNAKLHTDAGGRHAGQACRAYCGEGRVPWPYRTADAVFGFRHAPTYAKHLASYKHHESSLITISPYSVEALQQAFADADSKGWYVEAMFLEPVMGEGDPGRQVTPEFYARQRER